MKRLVRLLVLAALVGAVVTYLKRRPAPPSASPTAPPTRTERPAPYEAPVVTPSAAAGEPPSEDHVAPAWVDALGDRRCPEGYPVKAKVASKVFHVPGGALYDRTNPDRCYATPEAAEQDGFRPSKR